MENINFKASKNAPNPKEVIYWVDLTADPTGGVIKTFDGKKWNKIKGEAQSVDAYTKSESDNKFATKSEVNGKANKSTTLAGYGITDAYTKTEADGKYATKDSLSAKADKTALDSYALKTDLNAKANSSDVYVKAEVYTKSQCEAKITEMIEAAMTPAA